MLNLRKARAVLCSSPLERLGEALYLPHQLWFFILHFRIFIINLELTEGKGCVQMASGLIPACRQAGSSSFSKREGAVL